MNKHLLFAAFLISLSSTAWAQESTWRKDINPIVKAKCGVCH